MRVHAAGFTPGELDWVAPGALVPGGEPQHDLRRVGTQSAHQQLRLPEQIALHSQDRIHDAVDDRPLGR